MKINTNGLFRTLLFAAASIVALGSCSGGGGGGSSVSVPAVEFNVEDGSTVSEGTKVTFTCDTDLDVTKYYSFSEFSSSDYDERNDVYTAEFIDISASAAGDDGSLTIYAMAVHGASGTCSAVTHVSIIVKGPKVPVATVTSGAEPGSTTNIYASASITLESSYANNPEAEVAIYYSIGTALTKDTAATAETLYDGTPISLSGSLGDKIEVYAVALVTDGEETYYSGVMHNTYTVVVQYKPLTGTVSAEVESGNYTLDGNISDAVTAIGTSTSAKTFSEAITVSGYVTMTNGKTTNGNIYIQDKDTSIIIFGYELNSTAYEPGEYVEVTATKGQLYYGQPEISAYSDIKKDSTKNSTVLYYKNYTGKTDFSGLETIDLCGIKANKSEYTADSAIIASDESGELSHFGYVSYYSNDNKIKFLSQYTKDKSVIGDTESTLKNAVDEVSVSETAITSTDSVSLICATPDVVFYYAFGTELTSENYITAGNVYSSSIVSFPAGKSIVYVYAVKDDYEPWSGSFTVTCLGANDELIEFADYSGSIETSNSSKKDSTVTGANIVINLTMGTNTSNNPIYRAGDFAIRVYQNNKIVFEGIKAIKQITFNWKTVPENTFAADSGLYNAHSSTWSGLTEKVSFGTTGGSAYNLTSVIITYSDIGVYDEDVIFSIDDGYLVDSGAEVLLSVPASATGASIYYSTTEALDYSNAKTSGTLYSSPITINETTTVYAVLVSADEKTYSSGTSATYTVDTTSTFVSPATSISNGDVLYFYSVSGGVAMSVSTSAKGFSGVTPSVYNDSEKMKVEDTLLALTVEVSDGKMYLKNDDKYLTTTGNNNLSLTETIGDNDTSVFTITAVEDGSSVYYVSGTKAQLEWYKPNWTTYGTSKTGSAYEIKIYK